MDCYIGIDVAKATLAIATLPTGESWTVTNDDTGLHELIPRLLALTPTLVVLEATGGSNAPRSPPSSKPGASWSSPIRARCGISPKRSGASPRPTL